MGDAASSSEGSDVLLLGETDGAGGASADVGGAMAAGAPARRLKRWPKSILFIIGNEFCERFCFYGMRAVLTLYFLYYFGFSEDTAVSCYHAFIMLAYITPVFGGALADGSWGKFKTILVLSMVYVAGTGVMAFTAIPGATGSDPPSPWGAALGLLLIAIGTGGIKPCVASFGGDQIDTGGDGADHADVARMLQSYFAAFYFSINGGSFISTLVTPKLRADVKCFGRDDCFPAAFGVPGLLMFLATVLFVSGRRLYKVKTPSRNVTADFAGAVRASIAHRVSFLRGRSRVRYQHWLDAASKRYGRDFIDDVKVALAVMWLFLPLPIFWTLFDQSGSRWTVQATQMKTFSMGDLGDFRPDQMQAANSLLILLFIPLFEKGLYPAAARLGLPLHPLVRMTLGMMLCGVSFVMAAVLQSRIDADAASHVPAAAAGQNASLIRLVNAGAVAVNATLTPSGSGGDVAVGALAAGASTGYLGLPSGAATVSWPGLAGGPAALSLTTGGVFCVVMYATVAGGAADAALAVEDVFGRINGGAPVATARLSLVNVAPGVGNATLRSQFDSGELTLTVPFGEASAWASGRVEPGTQRVTVSRAQGDEGEGGEGGETLVSTNLRLDNGADYTLVLSAPRDAGSGAQAELQAFTAVEGGGVSILWQLPQYAVMTAGEILFSITGLEFAFTQAPASMKALLQAAWLLTVAAGSLIVIVVAESKLIEDQVGEFLFFAGLQGVVSLVFAVMARAYVVARRRKGRAAAGGGGGGVDEEATSLLAGTAKVIEG